MPELNTLLTPPSDHALVQAIANGERQALAQLYKKYASQLFGLAQRILMHRTDAEDLIQDVFIEVWHKAAQYEPLRGSVQTWLLQRVRSRAIDRLRALRRFQTLVEHELDQEIEHASDAALDRDADWWRTSSALLHLSEEQMHALELCYFHGMTYQAIAAHIGIPISTAKSRVTSAIEKLRRIISPPG